MIFKACGHYALQECSQDEPYAGNGPMPLECMGSLFGQRSQHVCAVHAVKSLYEAL